MTREELIDKLFDIAVRYYSHDAPTPDVGVSRSEHLLRMLRLQADWVLAHHDDIFGKPEDMIFSKRYRVEHIDD